MELNSARTESTGMLYGAFWDEKKPKVMVVGLNPSRADESVDDRTIRRVRQLAASWGFGGVYMLNLFAWITPFPEELEDCPDPIGDHDGKLEEYAAKCSEVVFAWGANEVNGRDEFVLRHFPNAKCIAKNLDGTPKHPLYVKQGVQLVDYFSSTQ